MKLRNKKTGEIVDYISFKECGGGQICMYVFDTSKHYYYNSLSKLNEEWEDVPEEPKEFYWIDKVGEIDSDVICKEFKEDIDSQKTIGNYFETEEEAEKAVERLRAWQRLKDKGFRFTDWYRDVCEVSIQAEIHDEGTMGMINDLNILFGGEE